SPRPRRRRARIGRRQSARGRPGAGGSDAVARLTGPVEASLPDLQHGIGDRHDGWAQDHPRRPNTATPTRKATSVSTGYVRIRLPTSRAYRAALHGEVLRAIAVHRVADRPDRFGPRIARRTP